MSKKKFSETKLGKFLQKVGSSIVDKAEDILPDSGFYGVVGVLFYLPIALNFSAPLEPK